MAKAIKAGLLHDLQEWLQAEDSITAAVLFGSQVRENDQPAAADDWSDIDLHLITMSGNRIEQTDWATAFPRLHFCAAVMRAATGGVNKITLLFEEGEVDLVLVPAKRLGLGRFAMTLRLHQKYEPMRRALNNLSTIMSGGYRFLKGEKEWEGFYRKVVTNMPGFRLSDQELGNMAEIFLCDLLWILQKLERGELVAAQRILHRSLAETNILFLHESRIRRGHVTYQQARRVEKLTSMAELDAVRINARLEGKDLHRAAWQAFAGMRFLMGELQPKWTMPVGMEKLLKPYSKSAV